MVISILTLFPEIFPPVFSSSIIGRAQKKKLVWLNFVNIRDFALDKHKSVDDKPFGGGVGMIMKVDVLDKAITSVKNKKGREKVILLDPKGEKFDQKKAKSLSKVDHLILICGHYEGVDDRITHFIDEKISIGDYILTGGEIPAMVMIDGITRLIPGVLSKTEATKIESFSGGFLEAPQFTRPAKYKGLKVPKVLLSGNHKEIDRWREKNRQSLK